MTWADRRYFSPNLADKIQVIQSNASCLRLDLCVCVCELVEKFAS